MTPGKLAATPETAPGIKGARARVEEAGSGRVQDESVLLEGRSDSLGLEIAGGDWHHALQQVDGFLQALKAVEQDVFVFDG